MVNVGSSCSCSCISSSSSLPASSPFAAFVAVVAASAVCQPLQWLMAGRRFGGSYRGGAASARDVDAGDADVVGDLVVVGS